jgi:flagellin
MGGLRVGSNLLSAAVEYNLSRNQSRLESVVTSLSTGLRINSAADDPSGLAIAQKRKAEVDGFDRAANNVQDAQNAAVVADGALATTTSILQRIRALAVEAAGDTTSQAQKADLQHEVSALLDEINAIAQKTQFNGTALLDGSRAGYQPEQAAFFTVTANSVLAIPGAAPGKVVTSATTVSVPNGDFTADPVAPNGATNIDPTDWNVFGSVGNPYLYNGSGGSSTPWILTPPAPPAPYANALSIGPQEGISQTLTGLTAGQQYTVAYSAWASGGSALSVQIDGANVGVAPTVGAFRSYVSQSFIASGTTATLSFDDLAGSPLSSIAVTGISLQSESTTTIGPGVNTGLLIACAVAANANFATSVGNAANGLSGVQGFTANSAGAGYTVDGTIALQVVNTGVSIAVQESFFDSAVAAANPVYLASYLLGANQAATLFDNVQVLTGNVTAADVGTTAYLKISQDVPALTAAPTSALTVQSGADEGQTVVVGIAAANTQTLRVANINLLLSASSNPSLGAEDAIGQIDNALTRLLAERAALGALSVRLGEDATNDATAATSEQSSESAIADLDIGGASTQNTRLQILVQAGTSLLAQTNANQNDVRRLFRNCENDSSVCSSRSRSFGTGRVTGRRGPVAVVAGDSDRPRGARRSSG